MIVKCIVFALWVLFMGLAALGRKVKFSGEPLEPLAALVAGPFIVLLLGVGFIGIGALFSIPIWIWFVPIS